MGHNAGLGSEIMTCVYISFAHTEKDLSESIAAQLRMRGVRVLRGEDHLRGYNWQGSSISAITSSDLVLALLGATNTNESVLLEIGYAVSAKKHVLLVAGDTSRIPLDISAFPVIVPSLSRNSLVDDIVHAIPSFRLGEVSEWTFSTAREHLEA